MTSFHKLYEQRTAAESIRSRYLEKVADLRKDRDLTDEARQRRIAEVHVKTQAALNKLRESESNDLHVRRTSLERTVFGGAKPFPGVDAGMHAISARDASDRAAQLSSPAEAAALLANAEADGDELLARAVARRSLRASDEQINRTAAQEWEDVTRVYLDARPHLMPVVEELAEIENMSEHQIFSPFSLPHPHGVEPQYLNTVGRESVDDAAGVGA